MKVRSMAFAVLVCFFAAATASAQTTLVPGHRKADGDGNGSADAGILVNNHYRQVVEFAPDFVCTYVVNTRGDFNNDPYLDSGRIMNSIRCTIGGQTVVYNYVIVDETHRRFTGDPDWAEYGGVWEYILLTESGLGNIVRNGR